MALGATQLSVLKLVIRSGMILVAIGVACGVAGSLALTRVMSTLVYEVEPTDPLSFGFALLVLTAVALLACYIPGRRAAKIHPLVALRYD